MAEPAVVSEGPEMRDEMGLVNATPELAVFASAVAALFWSLALSIPGGATGAVPVPSLNLLFHDAYWAVLFAFIAASQFWRLMVRTAGQRTWISGLLDTVVGFVAAFVWTFVAVLGLTQSGALHAITTAILAAGTWWDFMAYSPVMHGEQRTRAPRSRLNEAA